MKTKLSLSAGALFALAVFALAPSRSEAGLNYGTFPAYCTKNADGSGHCKGSLAGFRASSDPNAYVDIFVSETATWGIADFFASINGTFMSCWTNNAVMVDRLFWLSSHPGVFVVIWDTTGTCTQVYSYGYSYYN
jgi:hypothetical protein